MRTKLLLTLLLNFIVLHSQAQSQVHGVIKSYGLPLKDVEIINQNNSQMALSDENGNFLIPANVNDKITFYSDGYQTNAVYFDVKMLAQPLIVEMMKKTIELDEVIIEQNATMLSESYLRQIVEKPYFDDRMSSPKNQYVYDGQTLGIDFIGLAGKVKRLLKSKEKTKSEGPKIPFKEYISANFNESFFLETLGLQPEEIYLFLDYCEADPKAAALSNGTPFDALNFLVSKKAAFKK